MINQFTTNMLEHMKTHILFTVSMLLIWTDVISQKSTEAIGDKAFVISAADGGMLEVKLGELALKNAVTVKGKEFAKMMIKDHSKVNQELKSLADKKRIVLPSKVSDVKQQLYDSLSRFEGEQFDMMYMNMMIASHEETIGLYQAESVQGTEPDLKKWADSKIPALKHHLEMAKKLFPDKYK